MRGPLDFEDEYEGWQPDLDRLRRWVRGWTGWIAIVVIIGIWLATGFYQVGPSETGLIKRFGAHVGSSNPGIQYHLPWPFESVTIVDTKSRRKEEIGFRTISQPPNPRYQEFPEEALMLTGDGNIVWIDSVVQYDVQDPVKFAFNLRDPREVVRNATEAILREQVAQRDLDPILTTARDVIAQDVEANLQQLLDQYNTGIDIVNVKLQDVKPPKEVKAAFDDVNSARQDKETAINKANAYRNDVLPRARGEAAQIAQRAEGYRAETVAGAQGDVARFQNVLKQYELGDRSVTLERLYIEAMEDIVPNLRPMVITESISKSGTLNVLDLSRLIQEEASGEEGK